MSRVGTCTILMCGASAAAGAVIAALLFRKKEASENPTKMREIYETLASGRQYMEFHFTPGKELYPYKLEKICDAFDFALRVARKFKVFPPSNSGRVLDLGCAVGASSFELSKFFNEVVGVDLSNTFIKLANQMKATGTFDFEAPDQGLTTIPRVAKLPEGAIPARCNFVVGDALAVDPALGKFDGVLAANLLDRVPEPEKLLRSFGGLVNQGGILVLVSPYSWTEDATSRAKWLGGQPGGERTEVVVKRILGENFVFVSESDEPFLIRDHHRRFQLGFSHCTIWRRK